MTATVEFRQELLVIGRNMFQCFYTVNKTNISSINNDIKL
jgi:hypothetical protein